MLNHRRVTSFLVLLSFNLEIASPFCKIFTLVRSLKRKLPCEIIVEGFKDVHEVSGKLII